MGIMKVDRRRLGKIFEDLDMFNFEHLKHLMKLWQTLGQCGITTKEVVEYVQRCERDEQMEAKLSHISVENRKRLQINYKDCPDCGERLQIHPLTDDPKGRTAHLFCTKGWKCIKCKEEDRYDDTDPKDICGYEEFTTKPLAQIQSEKWMKFDKVIDELLSEQDEKMIAELEAKQKESK